MKNLLRNLNLVAVTLLIFFIGISKVSAGSAKISVSSGTSSIVVGNSFSVTVKISSSSELGSWEWVIDYDKSKFQLLSGDSTVKDMFTKKGTKSASYTYKFKAIGTGSGNITVKSAGAIDMNENNLSISKGSKTVKVITKAQLEASYSKDNYLKSLSVEGLKLSPSFSKSTTEYKVEADSNTTSINIKASVNDSKSSISGTGKHSVGEGENKFNIIVTAQNGSTRTYKVIVNVIDPNPIKTTINGIEYTIVKRESNLECPEDYEKTTIEIDGIKVPAFHNEINNFTLVGLNGNNETELYLYENGTYIKYSEIKLNQLKLYPLEMDKEFELDNDTSKENITIGTTLFNALKLAKTNYSIFHAKDLETGKDNYYLYDSNNNTVIEYPEKLFKSNIKPLQNKIENYKKMILLLGAETVIIIIILIGILIAKLTNNKKRRKELELKKKEYEEKVQNKKKNLNNDTKTIADNKKDESKLTKEENKKNELVEENEIEKSKNEIESIKEELKKDVEENNKKKKKSNKKEVSK